MSKLQKNNLVAQSNDLVNARFRITKNEFTLLATMISLLEPSDKEFPMFTIGVKEVADMLKIDKKSVFSELDKITDRLMKRISRIITAEGKYIKFTWLNSVTVNSNKNVISLQFHNFLKPYLLDLKKRGNFTQYRLGQVIEFKSFYTARMYGVLVEHYSKKTYKFEYSLDDFRQLMLGHQSTSYPLYKNFRNKVIDTARKELSTKDKKTGLYKADLSFELETKRAGRKISHLIFTIKTQQTKLTSSPQTKPQRTANNSDVPQIVLDYEAIGVMRKMVQSYLNQRGEQALQNTLNKFNENKEKGKIMKSEQGYLAYLLRVNAGQKTKQEKERKQKAKNNERLNVKKAKEEALMATFTKEREEATKGFFDSLQDGELEYMVVDFEASELFKKCIKSSPMLFSLYNTPDGVGMKDHEIKNYFNTFIIDQHLDKSLNNFTKWQERNADLK